MQMVVMTAAAGAVFAAAATEPAPPAGRPHVVFVTGDDEYRSEITMPMIAAILEQRHGMRCSVAYAVNDRTGRKEPKYHYNIEGLEALETADVAVFYLRYREVPDAQLKRILDYVDSGRPIVGLRTSTHAFQYKSGANTRLNDGFGRDVFGQRWIRHHGHDSSTNVYVALKDHPVTRGVAAEFHCRSWLYHVVPLEGDCVPLVLGSAVKGETPAGQTFGTPNPVAWTRIRGRTRVFFTTLGHPQDFEVEAFRRLLVNGIYWALGMEAKIPPDGTDVRTVGEYVAPPTH